MASKFEGKACPIIRTINKDWLLKEQKDLRDTTLVDLDLREHNIDWTAYYVDCSTLFIGCRLSVEEEIYLRQTEPP